MLSIQLQRFFKITKVVREIPNELGNQNRNASSSLAVTFHSNNTVFSRACVQGKKLFIVQTIK